MASISSPLSYKYQPRRTSVRPFTLETAHLGLPTDLSPLGQGNPDCRIYTEAWPVSLTWLDGAPLVSRELAPCPNAPEFRMQFFHMYHDWTHEANTRDAMVLVRPRIAANSQPAALPYLISAHTSFICDTTT